MSQTQPTTVADKLSTLCITPPRHCRPRRGSHVSSASAGSCPAAPLCPKRRKMCSKRKRFTLFMLITNNSRGILCSEKQKLLPLQDASRALPAAGKALHRAIGDALSVHKEAGAARQQAARKATMHQPNDQQWKQRNNCLRWPSTPP